MEGAGGTGGPDCGARGRRRSLAGRPVGGRRYKRQHTRSHWCGGRRRDRRARLQCPWAAAGPGRTTSRRTEPHVSTPGPTGVEGAGGSCRGAGGRRRVLPRCRWAAAGPAAVPVGGGGAWPGFEPTHPATRQYTKRRRRGGRRRVRRARAGFEIDTSEPQARVWRSRGRPGPTAPGTPAEPQATTHGADGSRAGRRPPAHTAAEPSGARNTRGTTTQRNEAATGCPATASSRSRSAVHNSATSNQAVMST